MATGTLVMGLFDSRVDADRALTQIFASGFSRDDLSIVAADDKAAAEFGINKHTKVGEGAAIGAGVMGALGAAVVGFAAVGSIVTAGAGLIIAGPIVAALAGAGAGAAAGGVIGGLIGLGIPDHEIQVWSERVRKGAVLLGVRCQGEGVDRVKQIFKDHNATNITTQSISLDAPGARRASGAVDGTTNGRRAVSADDWGKTSALHRLFAEQLRDIYYAEHKLADSLQSLEQKANAPDLCRAIHDHREQTLGHITRLDDVFETIGVKPEQKNCPAINGIISETKELLTLEGDPPQRDAAIICAAQKAEHYEIGTYGCLRTYARLLGLDRPAQLLQQTLDEEWNADGKLSELAESGINRRAIAAVA